jgi:hypothetical protein
MAMNHKFIILAGLLGTLCLNSCERKEVSTEATAFEKFDSPWAHEEHWMVSGTVRDLQGMQMLCGTPQSNDPVVPTAKEHQYQVGMIKLEMKPSCWDIASYQSLLAGWSPKTQIAPPSPQDFLQTLLTPKAKVLQNANHLISKRIEASPAAPEVHEEAAFLLGVFGMRENARNFGDLRPLLGRMTAHLTMANHFRAGKPPSILGQWALIFHHLHAGRPLLARDSMQTIAKDGDSEHWRRVVELLITKDWRQTVDFKNLSLAEAIAHSRALQIHSGNEMMMKFVSQHEALQAIPDWSRMLSGFGNSVDEGHMAMNSCLGMEFVEIAEIFKIGENPTPSKLASFIAQQGVPALVCRDGQPQVISNEDWAAYFRRHFYMNCADISYFVLTKWSSHEDAVEWQNSVMPYCKLLPDQELVASLLATSERDFQEDLKTTAAYIRKNPERVPMGLWYDYQFSSLDVSAQTHMPDQASWFREVSPPGTAHDPTRRLRFSGIAGNWLFHMKQLHAIDPWNSDLCAEISEEAGYSPEAVKAVWGEMYEYSVRPLKLILKGSNLTNPQRIDTLRSLIELEPEAGFQLGSLWVIENQPHEAIKAYEAAYQKTEDRVAVSNQSRWMIYYYKSKGKDEKAREIADHHAEVYSLAGLEAAMALAIFEKDLERGLRLAAAIEDRYETQHEQAAVEWFISGNTEALDSVFPNGIREVTLADFSHEKNPSGCRIMDSSSTLRGVGMRPGDVLVAIDGKRVENFSQYLFLMAPRLDPSVRIIFQRGKKYEEISCQLPDQRFHVEMQDVGQ